MVEAAVVSLVVISVSISLMVVSSRWSRVVLVPVSVVPVVVRRPASIPISWVLPVPVVVVVPVVPIVPIVSIGVMISGVVSLVIVVIVRARPGIVCKAIRIRGIRRWTKRLDKRVVKVILVLTLLWVKGLSRSLVAIRLLYISQERICRGRYIVPGGINCVRRLYGDG